MRLNKLISESGVCSRREADDWIAAGRVTVNGKRAEVGAQVEDSDEVCVDGQPVGPARKKQKPVTIALNKPVGIICTTERDVADNIIDFVDHPERIFPIGRLDRDSEGLILLTNDGDIVNHILRVENAHEKEYVVAVDRPLTESFLATMARGVNLRGAGGAGGRSRERSERPHKTRSEAENIGDARTRPCRVYRESARVFRIVLTQGLNRQIRRMCEALGYRVVALRRIRIMNVELGHLKPGRWRNLSPAELHGLLSGKRGGGGERPRRGPPPRRRR